MAKKKKQHYKLKNGSVYNQALIDRGSLTLWIDADKIQVWHQSEKNMLVPYQQDFKQQMDVAEKVMKRYRSALHELAK